MHVLLKVRKIGDFTTSTIGLTNSNQMFWLGNFEIQCFFISDFFFLNVLSHFQHEFYPYFPSVME